MIQKKNKSINFGGLRYGLISKRDEDLDFFFLESKRQGTVREIGTYFGRQKKNNLNFDFIQLFEGHIQSFWSINRAIYFDVIYVIDRCWEEISIRLELWSVSWTEVIENRRIQWWEKGERGFRSEYFLYLYQCSIIE